MGMNINQFRKEMQSGALNSNDALPRFGNQLSAESLGSVGAASKSGAASVGRLQNSFAGLQAAVGDKIMAPTIMGLQVTTTAADTLKNNIDTLGKVFAAALLSAAASAIGLSAGIGLANPVLGFLIRGLITSLPLLKTFALQTAVAYAAIEVFNTVMGSINDSSPFKSLADESEAAFAKISKGADQTTQDINKLKDEIYGKDRSVFQVIGDGISGAFGGQTSITNKADNDTINADRILDQNEKALKRKPPESTEANRNRRSEIELELSVVRSQNANLTSKDRDKIDLNNKREQELVQERSTLEKPINTRQAELQQVIKNANNIIDSPLRNPTEKALATTQLAEAEKEQRKLQEQLVSSASTLAVGLRKVGEGLQAGLAAIDLASINSKTQIYLAAAQDARNTGALAQANFADTTTNLSAKQSLQQQSVNTLKSTIYAPENRGTVQALGVDPENVSQEQIDRLKSTVTDTRGQSLLGYLSKYQQVKTELAQTNQSLFETQYSYIKSIADYNKGLADQNINLRNSLVNLQLTARTSIVNLQQQIEQTLIEIDTNSSKAMFQAQRNKIQGAYNKFLEKLGISTDSIFDQLFQNYNSVVDSIQQISERRISNKQGQNTADNRQINNETKKAQTRVERDQRIEQIQRENTERQLSNPLNQPSSGANSAINSGLASGDTNLIKPIASSAISSGFGDRIHPFSGKKQFHAGTDYPIPVGTSVKASGEGVVTFAGTKGGYGYAVDIKHGSGETTRYAHLSQIGVQVGQQVAQGQQIALSGGAKGQPGSGTSTGAHLHFETRNANDEPIDPIARLRQKSGIQSPVNAKPATGVCQFCGGDHSGDQHMEMVNSSTYTPGGGGMNGGEVDSRGNRLTRKDYAIAIPGQNRVKDQIPYGSTVKLNYGGRTVTAKVTDGGPYVPGRQMDMTTAAAKALKFDGVGEVGVTLATLPKGADPNKKYYFGEATYKPRFGKGGSVSNAEAKKAIASVVQGDKYVTLGNGVQSSPTPGKVIDGTGEVDIAKIRRDAAQGQPAQEQTLNNQLQQQALDQKIQTEQQFSTGLIKKTDTLVDVDSVMGKEKLRQERNLSNQQTAADRAKIDTQILKNRNLLNRELPASNRKSTELERQSEAYNRSQNRTPYQKIDTLYQQYGGVGESSTLDNSIIDSRSTIDRLKEESRVRKENILKQIQSIEAYGTGWVNLRKTLVQQIKDLKAKGFKTEADSLQTIVTDNDAALGTPKARQGTIDQLSKQFRTLPSDGAAVYDAIAPGASKVIADSRSVSAQYLPKTFDDGLKAEARSIIERFRTTKEALQAEFTKLDEAVGILEAEIQAKFKAAGYAPQKLDLTDPRKLELLRKVAPEETAKFEEATLTRSQVSLAGKNLDRNAETAAARSVSIGQRREKLSVDRANTDYLATTQDGNLFSQIQVDKQRFTQGKTDLDLQFNQGAISADLYAVKLKQLGLETNTLRNAIQPLRGATTGFFDDIFKGQGIFDGLGTAMRNLTINILKNFQDLISKHLGQQLFGSLSTGAEDIQNKVSSGHDQSLFGKALRAVGLVNPGSKTNTTAGIDIGLSSPVIDDPTKKLDIGLNSSIFDDLFKPKAKSIPGRDTLTTLLLGLPSSHQNSGGGDLLGGLLGLLGGGGEGGTKGGLDLGLLSPLIPGFATGGMVTSPTLALVGEGINNEAIVPLPNGRSIPVDLKGAGQSSGGVGDISNSISVTIQNSGQAKETSRGDSLAIANLVRNLVTEGLINEKRAGGLLA
jgi:murein DD-endopeptidase MepM/ murein hydrolase activator NlpD